MIRPLPFALLLLALCCGLAPARPLGQPWVPPTDQEKTLVVALDAAPAHLNPAISTASALHRVADPMFNGLITLGPDGTPRPDLAERWVASDGPAGPETVYRFTLRSGIRWHDGARFSAEDVVFTFREILFRHHARARLGLANFVETIEAPDERTVVFRLRRPVSAFLSQLDVTDAPILPRHLYEGTDPLTNPLNQAPVGTGPYRFQARGTNGEVLLARNDDYFKMRQPAVSHLLFRLIPSAAEQAEALRSGRVDYLPRLDAREAERLAPEAGPGGPLVLRQVSAGPGGSNCQMSLAFNLARPLLASLPLRLALARGIDRAALAQAVVPGQGEPARAPLAAGLADFIDPALALPGYDPDAARAELAARGPLSLELLAFAAFEPWVRHLAGQLGALGVTLRPRLVAPGEFEQAVFQRRDFDLALVSYCHGLDPALGAGRMFASQAIGMSFGNAAGFDDPAMDAALSRAFVGPRAARIAAWGEVQRQAIAAMPYVWLVDTRFTVAWRSAFTGFAPWSGQFAEAVAPRQ